MFSGSKRATQVGSTQWHDRNPKTIPLYAVEYGGKAGVQTAWSYTVPANRKAFLEVAFLMVYRATQASSSSQAAAEITYVAGGNACTFATAQISTNNVGDQDKAIVGLSVMMKAGDLIYSVWADESTGGECIFIMSAKLTEFDA
jgi:hypothetical protein